MEVVLLDIVQSNYCYYDLYSECAEDIEAPDDAVCRECIVWAHADTIRQSGNGTH